MKANYVSPEFETVSFTSDEVLTCSGEHDIDFGDLDLDVDVDVDIKLNVIEWFKERWGNRP